METMKPEQKCIDEHRDFWKGVAQNNGWDREQFHVQIWHNKEGEIMDSVSHKGLEDDIFVEVDKEEG